ncbi:MAG: hypothetical protein ACRDOX_08920 [Nocardioides sp.]
MDLDHNWIGGRAGDDRIWGGSGNDELLGQQDRDRIGSATPIWTSGSTAPASRASPPSSGEALAGLYERSCRNGAWQLQPAMSGRTRWLADPTTLNCRSAHPR